MAGLVNGCIIARESNVVRVDFGRRPEPPAPRFPGAGALRGDCPSEPLEHEPGMTHPFVRAGGGAGVLASCPS